MPPATSRIISLSRKVKRAGWKYPLTKNDEHALLAGCYYDSALAHKPIDWIECFCRLSDGPRAGQRIELADWQTRALQAIFGWQRPDGTRRYRKVYITIAKKNFKSTFCGCLALYGLEADGEQGAYIYLAAVDSDQTDQVFHPAAEMVRRSPALAKRYKVIESQQTIRHGTNAWIQSLASDSGSSEGLNAHFMIIDELHAWKNQEFYDSLEYASIARRQPLELVITTRGSDPIRSDQQGKRR